jgi:serine/threonine-protein kinase
MLPVRPRYTLALLLSSVWLLGGCSSSDSPPEDPPLLGFDESTRKPLFPPGAPWNQDISSAPVDSQSGAVISYMQSRGWGFGRMQIDFSIELLVADEKTPMRTFQPTEDFYEDECDAVPVPVPPGGFLEGEEGYRCTSDGDCHLLVLHKPTRKLYEQWRVDIDGSTYRGGCLAVWDLTRVYPPEGRGNDCTSADAAGLPIAPLLFDADEVAAGEIRHAIRFILPNDRIRHATYVHPATHATRAASGGTNAPPYGARLRLRADYPVDSLPTAGARVVARALQRYGMFLADGGNITLTAQSDRLTTAKWAGLLGPRDLQAIQPQDFQLVEAGARLTWNGECVRTP